MIITDTGFWLALRNRDDKHHAKAKVALEQVREPLVTTWPVMAETCHLLMARLSVEAQVAFVQSWVDGAFRVFDVAESHGPRMVELLEQYAELPMDLADASLVVLAEELGTGRILSTDQRDFRAYRWKNRKPFKNLLLP